MNTTRTLTMIATAVAVTAGTAAIAPSADAHSYRHHYYYGNAFSGTYARTRVYAADYYYRRPYQQDVNPDFQLGANRSR
jgi:hypothetical protein